MYCSVRSDSVICALLITDKHLTFYKSVSNKLDLTEVCYALCPDFVFFYKVCIFNFLLLLHGICIVQFVLCFWCSITQRGCVLMC